MDATTRARLLAAVDEGFDDQIALTMALTAIPSLKEAEAPAQDFMARELRARGLDVDRFRVDPDRLSHLPGYSPPTGNYDAAWNVVGQYRAPVVQGRSLILNGHVDVVPVGPADMWQHPPFAPHVAGDWLCGRGAADMKAGVIAMLAVLDAIRRAGFDPAADICVQSVMDEECTGLGTLACLERGYRAEAVMIPEPMQECLIGSQIGVMWFQVTVKGHPVHVREAGSGANAIMAAYEVIAALQTLEADWNSRRHSDPGFAQTERPIALNIGRIAGGDWASSVPAWCRFDCRIALYPGQDLAKARAEIEACVAKAAAANAFLRATPPLVSFSGFQAEGFHLQNAAAPVGVLQQAHEAVFGQALQTIASTATTDARFFALYGGMPALVYGPRSENIHGFNERVDLRSLRRVTQAMTLFVAGWCGLLPRI